ncbi:MAG: arylsulfatase A-like enzyme [Verrucomicrobiales bacterium]|jgi:arylsulfatase A-like enzyme
MIQSTVSIRVDHCRIHQIEPEQKAAPPAAADHGSRQFPSEFSIRQSAIAVRAVFAMKTFLAFALALPILTFAQEKPNIVLVMADDQGWGDMAYNGDPLLKTPNFDSAAAEGLRFDRFYAAAPVCSPTRASVLTGRHPNRMGVFKWGNTLRPQEITIAEALKTAGYATSHFGKWHLGSVRKGSPVSPGASGFDEWLSAPNFYDNDPILSHRGEAVAIEGESSMVAVDAAIDWMRTQVEGETPFLSVVWFGSPHSPHRAAAEDFELYKDQPEAKAHFLGEITGMDRAFGKLRSALDEIGIRENTILWYCSDNGALGIGNAGEFRGKKGSIYEGGLLVPSILEWPAKIPQPAVSTVRCNTSDIYPTLLDIVGVKVENQTPLDGHSLVPIIGDRQTPDIGRGFWDFPIDGKGMKAYDMMKEVLDAQAKGEEIPPAADSLKAAEIDPLPPGAEQLLGHAAWIESDWKLHRIGGKKVGGDVKWELYNLAKDPSETKDLAESEGERVAAMRRKLEAWMKSVLSSLQGEDY